MFQNRKSQWPALTLRLALAMQLFAASVGYFHLQGMGLSGDVPSFWLGPPIPRFLCWFLASAFILLAIAKLFGLHKGRSSLILALLLVLTSWAHLFYDPLYNLSEAILLLLLVVLGLLWVEDQRNAVTTDDQIQATRDRSTKTNSWIAFVLRLFVGGIFVSQGFHNAFRHGGVIEFARRVYVEPFHGRIPDWLLWAGGISNPPWELGGGLLLILGLFTSEACLGMFAFLLIVIFGHCLDDLGSATAGMRDYALANLFCVLLVYAIARREDRLSIRSILIR